jgi:excisionase family DNA binding protein
MMCIPQLWWTTREAAHYLKISPVYLRQLAKEGKIKAHRIPIAGRRRQWRYLQAELDEAMRSDLV